MVRRWSSIIKFNLNFKLTRLELFKKFSKKRVFKLTVSTRKFYKKYTKYRRKSFNRIRHKNNWSFYWNIFKFWSQSYLNSRTFYKKYWLLNLFKYSFLSFNINSLKLTENDLFFNNNFLLLSFNTFFNFQNNIPNFNNLKFLNKKNANLFLGFIENDEFFTDAAYNNLYSCYDFYIYENLIESNLSIQNHYNFNFHLNFFIEKNNYLYLKNYYKLLILINFF